MPTKHRTKRRAISVRGITYQRLANYLETATDGPRTISGFIEAMITEKLDAAGVPVPTEVKPCKNRPAPEIKHGQYFTF